MTRSRFTYSALALFGAMLIVGCGDDDTAMSPMGSSDASTGDTGSTSETPTTETAGTSDANDTGDTGAIACGNGEVDPSEECDGTNHGDASCEDLGFDGGDLGCTALCAFDTAACCNDACASEGATHCNGDTIELCTASEGGCLVWTTLTDCRAEAAFCDETGGEASCQPVCIDQCATAGDTQCLGDLIETCVLKEDTCLGWETGVDCASSGEVCDDTGEGATCTCVDTCPTDGVRQCSGASVEVCTTAPDGCLAWDVETTCGLTQTCEEQAGDAFCIGGGEGNDCSTAIQIQGGTNIVSWDATTLDYLSQPAIPCTTFALDGPDVVLSYTPSFTGAVDIVYQDKPTSVRYILVVSDQTCGSWLPPLACMSEFSGTTMEGSINVVAGETYYFYVVDTNSGAAPLQNPFTLTLTEIDCSNFAAKSENQFPEHQSTTTTLLPSPSIDFEVPVATNTGVVTITGNMGTNLVYDLSQGASAVSFSNANRSMTINPGVPFPPGETVTVTWSGIVDASCGNPLSPPPWTFDIIVPPCAPGTNGMVGTNLTALTTGLGTTTEYYVATDDAPDGYVYVGGATVLYRLPKSGGFLNLESIHSQPGVVSGNLGYDMIVVGDQVFTLNSKTTGTDGHLYRISSNGGATWNAQDAAIFPSVPQDKLRGITHRDGRLYMPTHEATAGVPTEIWSVDITGALPTAAILEAVIPDERHCAGIAMDDVNYYLACGTGDRVLRVNRTTQAVDLLTDAWPISTITASLKASDVDDDGIADHLYLQSNNRQIHYVCDPAGPLPYSDLLVSFGASSTVNYGLDYDPVANVLWSHHDVTKDFVRVE